MKQIDPQAVINKAKQGESQTSLTKSPEKILSKTDLPIHWIAEIFKKFQARYLHKWTSAIDGLEDCAVKEWSEKLRGVTGEQIKNGLDTWSEDWPPSADEFRKCCIDYQDKSLHGSAAYKDYGDQKKLNQLKASKKTANTERDKLRKLGLME